MPDRANLLVYGAYGYSGRLIVAEALRRGYRPTVAGRNSAAVGRLAAEFDLRALVLSVEDRAAVRRALESHRVLLNCAGPFAHTAGALSEACLETGTHYLDITGEIGVFEQLAARGAAAAAAGVFLLPGVGFDVVPSDCLASHLAGRLPDARRLVLAFRAAGGVSRGTALTMVDRLGSQGAVRRDGRIVPVPLAWKTRRVDLGRGPRLAVTIPWGDVATAFHSTGIPDIEVYAVTRPATVRLLRGLRWLGPLLANPPVRALLRSVVRRRVTGPSGAEREHGYTVVWGEAATGDGRSVRARVTGPEGYTLTAQAAVRAVELVLDGAVRGGSGGFRTPASAFGPDFVLQIPGTAREDLP